MPFRWQSFAVPKRGNSANEYEDAFAGNPRKGRFAIADGASESSFASLWARLLVEGFTQAPRSSTRSTDWLEPLRQRWSSQVDSLDLPWYAEAKRDLGASATFLGLTFKPSAKNKAGVWLASGVGDCCCFQIQDAKLVNSVPELHSQDFGNHPKLLNSKSERNESWKQDQFREAGKWRPGDRFLLMTDALAQWFLMCHEEDARPWETIAQVLMLEQPESRFSCWIDELRDKSRLRNDDATLVVIDVK
jgi:Protein phosphatase 2C